MKSFLVLSAIWIGGAALAGGPVETPVEPDPSADPTPKSGQDWTGFYLGISVTDGTAHAGDGTASEGTDLGISGAGLQAGYLRDLGRFVLGGELAYVDGDFGEDSPDATWDVTRLKLIGGYDAGRLLPYAFVGLTDYDILSYSPFTDTMTNYGIGARYRFGASGTMLLGLEYLFESKANYAGTIVSFDNRYLALRLDCQF